MIAPVAETSPLELAWAEYDAAVLRLHAAYGAAGDRDTLAGRRARMELGLEAVRLWTAFMALAEVDLTRSAA
ncbi:hypothetical protein U1839_06180 [Sphingomonas sp. RT2P30]|uniref:hypothetical protein n=1 Tax=Parasphingomonas halimpatiens TaxID=3096162 RepID=UPI002FCA7DD1